MVFALSPALGLAVTVLAVAVALLGGRWPGFAWQGTGTTTSPKNTTTTYCYANGVTTLAEGWPEVVRCFAVSGGRFIDVFTPDKEAPAPDLRPGHVIPGLWDGHGHLIMYGETLASASLVGTTSTADVRQRLAAFRSAHPGDGGPDRWLRGFGWDQNQMTNLGGAMPAAADLEGDDAETIRGLYVLLDRIDAHCVWVSPAVLALLPADVVEGASDDGRGRGVFCDNDMDAVLALWPKPDRADKTHYIQLAMAALREKGLVGIHDAGVVPEDLELYQDLVARADASDDDDDDDDGNGNDAAWTLRVYAMLECPDRNTFCPDALQALRRRRPADSPFLAIRSVKLFADGALGSWGSALLAPYADRPDTAGDLLVPNCSALVEVARQWAAAAVQVCIHAIGDRAARCAVDAFEAALALDLCPAQPPAACQHARARFRLEHAQIVHPRDLARIHELQLIPSVQPTHATSDMAYAELRLGPNRTATEAYRMRSFLHGYGRRHPLVLGSDFPIEPPDPFQGLYAAVARRSPHTGKGADGHTTDPWYPQEALTLDEALAGFTSGPAYAAFLNDQAGAIQPGALADWVVLDRPLHAYDIEELRTMRVRETWVGGRCVYKRDDNGNDDKRNNVEKD